MCTVQYVYSTVRVQYNMCYALPLNCDLMKYKRNTIITQHYIQDNGGFASKPHNSIIPETDFFAVLDRYDHYGYSVKISYESKHPYKSVINGFFQHQKQCWSVFRLS